MVATNGARRGQADHPAIPLTDDALIDTVLACEARGAQGVHLHIRDNKGMHLLDASHYRALLNRLEVLVPQMYLQVTSESAGLYEAAEQQAMVRELKPKFVSVALREMVRSTDDWPRATEFYTWAANNDVEIQHILYAPEELQSFLDAIEAGRIPGSHHLLLFVLGSYDGSKKSEPAQVAVFSQMLATAAARISFDWMLCAFGKEETDCLLEAIRLGGKARIGFENSFHNADGTVAKDNAERVAELYSRLPPDQRG